MPRKHLIASGINKKQQHQAKIWMKCAKEIKAAAKVGGVNPEANPRLKAAIIRGLSNNLSRESIDKNIKGASSDKTNFKELFYEGYGPNGLAILIKVLTDNEQRAVSAIRGYFSKINGQLAKPNSVKILFKEMGEFIIDANKYAEDTLMNIIIESEFLDLVHEEEYFVIYTKPNDFYNIKTVLDNNEIEIIDHSIKYIPESYIDIGSSYAEKWERFISNCEDDDDIQWMVSNNEN